VEIKILKEASQLQITLVPGVQNLHARTFRQIHQLLSNSALPDRTQGITEKVLFKKKKKKSSVKSSFTPTVTTLNIF